MPSNRKIYITLTVLLAVSALLRAFIAGFIELGNDEVYYWTYAKFPALSHFDHPPMVGLVIQLFSLNLTFDHEFFIRLASVVCGTISTWLIFLTGKTIKNSLTGLYAALLFTASFYGFVLTGLFILPDSPQVVFWLLALLSVAKALPDRDLKPENRNYMILAGVSAGLALLSKYHSVFLVAGVAAYIVFYNRRWLAAKETWLAFACILLLIIPILVWNADNGFISFTFHENRVGITAAGIQLKYFFTEIAGEFFYNNPVNVIIILCSLTALFFGRKFLDRAYLRLLFLTSLPLIAVFVSFSLFRPTLPHWTGPGYLGLILIAASWLSEPRKGQHRLRLIPWPIVVALAFQLTVTFAAVSQIHYGWVPFGKWKVKDVTADLAGWRQLGQKFAVVVQKDRQAKRMQAGSPVLTFRWFPAANLDYYAASPAGIHVYATGSLERIHKYYWINRVHGPIARGSEAYYIALSDDYEDPAGLYGKLYDTILPPDTLYMTRNRDTIRKAFVYRLKGLKQEMNFR